MISISHTLKETVFSIMDKTPESWLSFLTVLPNQRPFSFAAENITAQGQYVDGDPTAEQGSGEKGGGEKGGEQGNTHRDTPVDLSTRRDTTRSVMQCSCI